MINIQIEGAWWNFLLRDVSERSKGMSYVTLHILSET